MDATDGARELLSSSPNDGDDWSKFLSFTVPRFPDIEEQLARLSEIGRLTLAAATREPMTLRAEWLGGLSRIALLEPLGDRKSLPADGFSQRALEEEIEALRSTMDRAPFPAWREDATGTITWANRAYLDLGARMRTAGKPLPWPIPFVFPPLNWDRSDLTGQQRVSLSPPGESGPSWYDIHSYPHGGDRVLFAMPADEAVHAETALRSFVQTLTKTFAHLTIGLAIFDREGRLTLFNPALIDLTGMPPDFLSARPTLFRLLDAMRERQMLPEPEDYKTWRAEIAALQKAAASGQHEETWTLPNGQTYRVTGSPHPDGAVAFVIEDISAEMSQNRRFRSDLETSHAVINSFDEAVAVFSPSGLMMLTNSAYNRLWHDHEETPPPQEPSITEAVRLWQRHSAVSPVWNEARSFVMATGERVPWRGGARMSDGRLLVCRFVPLPGGASLIGFSVDPASGEHAPLEHRDSRRQSA